MTIGEDWRDAGDGMHSVSNLGRVRTREKWVGRAPQRFVPPRLVDGLQILKLGIDVAALLEKIWPDRAKRTRQPKARKG